MADDPTTMPNAGMAEMLKRLRPPEDEFPGALAVTEEGFALAELAPRARAELLEDIRKVVREELTRDRFGPTEG